MKVVNLREMNQKCFRFDDPIRESFIQEFTDVRLTGRNIHYPNCLLYSNNTLMNPYDERVMSLKRDSFYESNEWSEFMDPSNTNNPRTVIEEPVFFFIYNVDNYFHFVYDTLPILASYFELKSQYPNLKLLLNTSHPSKLDYSPFVKEFLEAYGADAQLTASQDTLYRKIFVSTSFTHGQKSNEPPSHQALIFWSSIKKGTIVQQTPKRFYISRRSWIHGQTQNMGTNYTTRRKCMNEDAVVELLAKYGIEEVFTELLTTQEKIVYFQNAELVVGVIGGGMCNLLFSPKKTKSLCIPTPYFRLINERFEHSMNHTALVYSECAIPAPFLHKFKLFSRVRVIVSGRIGEVEEYENGLYTVSLSSNDIAGFSQDFSLEKQKFQEFDLEAVDDGLNSPYVCDLVILERDLKSLLGSA
jgi:hypothetical protein